MFYTRVLLIGMGSSKKARFFFKVLDQWGWKIMVVYWGYLTPKMTKHNQQHLYASTVYQLERTVHFSI